MYCVRQSAGFSSVFRDAHEREIPQGTKARWSNGRNARNEMNAWVAYVNGSTERRLADADAVVLLVAAHQTAQADAHSYAECACWCPQRSAAADTRRVATNRRKLYALPRYSQWNLTNRIALLFVYTGTGATISWSRLCNVFYRQNVSSCCQNGSDTQSISRLSGNN